MWAEEIEQGFGLCVVVLLPGIDAAAKRVDVAELAGAQAVDCLRGVEDGDTCSGSAMAHTKSVALKEELRIEAVKHGSGIESQRSSCTPA